MSSPEWTPPPSEIRSASKQKKALEKLEKDNRVDSDLEPEKRYLLRLPGQSAGLLVIGTADAQEATSQVLAAIQKLDDLRVLLNAHGFEFGETESCPVQRFYLRDGAWILTHSRKDVEVFALLVGIIARYNNTAHGRVELQKQGVRPLIPGM